MPRPPASARFMRVAHRYLGFFLAGIMGVYALSGIVLVFRDTDAFKRVDDVAVAVAPGLTAETLAPALDLRRVRVEREEAGVLYWADGRYDAATGEARYVRKELPYLLERMTHLHKAKSAEPLFWLNVSFGVGLLFFVASAFWMFLPGGTILRRGLAFAAAGAALTLALLLL